MNELLIAFLILIITASMIGVIYLICKADRKIVEVNDSVEKVKNTDLNNLIKIVEILHSFNKNIDLGALKYYFEIALTAITTTKLFLLIKKLNNKNKEDEN